jgi:hypothetical protein
VGLLSAQALAEFRRLDRRAYYVMEAAFPDGTKRYAKQPISSASQGQYRPRVKQWGTISRSLGDRQFSLIGLEASPTITDFDFEFADLVGSRARIQDTAVTIKILSKRYTYAQAPTRFLGRLYDWEQTGQLEWQWKLRPNDGPLFSVFPWLTVQTYDFPDAPVESISQIIPLIYGLHDSAGSSAKGDRGAVPLIYVGKRGLTWCYVVCRGRARQVLRVYDDSILVPLGGYVVTYVSVNGRVFTLVEFDADRGDTASITADVEGYAYLGDGSVDDILITDPADQLAHLFSNWLYGEFAGEAAWLPTHPIIDTASFTALKAYFARRAYGASYKGSMWIGELTSGKQLVDDWCATNQVHAFWKNNGTFAVAADDLTEYPLPADPRIVFPTDELGRSFKMLGPGSADVIRRVVLEYAHQAGTGQYLSHLEILDKSVQIEATESLSQIYGPHFL